MNDRQPILRLTVILCAVLLARVGLNADAPKLQARLDSERITLDLKEASSRNFFGVVQDLLGVPVRYECPEDRVFTFAFTNLKVRTALDAVCESTGLAWTVVDGPPPVVRVTCGQGAEGPGAGDPFRPLVRPEKAAESETGGQLLVKGRAPNPQRTDLPVTINLRDAGLADALNLAAQLLEAKLALDPGLSGRTLTLDLDRVPVRRFLDEACKQAGAAWTLQEGTPPLLVVVKTP